MKFIHKISPPFLREFNTFLRVNYPWIWATKIHIHVYLTVLLTALFALVGLAYSIDLDDVPGVWEQGIFWVMLFVPAIAFAMFMMFNMALFNPDKRGAYRFRYQEFFVFLIYLITFSLPLAIPHTATTILNARIDALIDDEALKMDEINYNYALPFFDFSEYDNYNLKYYPNDSLYLKLGNHSLDEYDDELYEYYSEYRNSILDSSQREESRLWSALCDSIFNQRGIFEKSRPKLYYQKSYNEGLSGVSFFDDVYYDERKHVYSYSSRDSLYQLYLEGVNVQRNLDSAQKYIHNFELLLMKYADTPGIDKEAVLSDFENHVYVNSFTSRELRNKRYRLVDNLNNLHRTKLNKSIVFNLDAYTGLLATVFIITVLFSIFKNVHWKQFVLALAVHAVIITLLSIVVVSLNLDENFILGFGVFFTLALLGISIKGFALERFSIVYNQINIYLNVVLPFLLILILGYLSEVHDIFEIAYFDKYKVWIEDSYREPRWEYNSAYHSLVTRIITLTVWASALLYILVWNSYLKKLYLKYWFLPKKS